MMAKELWAFAQVCVHCHKEKMVNEDHWVKELPDEAHLHERSTLAAHIDDVREQERRRIERDLHDDLGAHLNALKMMLQPAGKSLPADPYRDDRYADVDKLLDASIASLHRISDDLRPGVLDAGLVAALEWLSSEFERQTGVACEFHCKDLDMAMDARLVTTLFRVALEACNNIRKHANASGVDMHLHADGSELLIEVIDNGRGISNEQRDSPRSFGLRSMEERIAAIGGSLRIVSRPGKGTMISARIPILQPF
ncbi:MAG: sensor histidine kinase [Oxalobacteraceae bacterium]